MDSNVYSDTRPTGLGPLAAAVDDLAGQDLAALPDAEAAERVLVLRGLLERLEGQWLRELAAVDARGAAGAEDGVQAVSTAGWLARPGTADDGRNAAQRRADALTELARRALEGGSLPQTGGVRPQVMVTVELASLLGAAGVPGGEGGWASPLPVETARRLACDAAVTRAVVARDGGHSGSGDDGGDRGGLAGRLRAAVAMLPPALGGAPSRPLDLGRTARVVSAAQRNALAVRDGGCAFPGCDRPVAWCEAHHLRHWLSGGPTDLANLVLLCRAHHRAVHEGGWRIHRHAHGDLKVTPPPRRPAVAA
jgi:hypothetical protein